MGVGREREGVGVGGREREGGGSGGMGTNIEYTCPC